MPEISPNTSTTTLASLLKLPSLEQVAVLRKLPFKEQAALLTLAATENLNRNVQLQKSETRKDLSMEAITKNLGSAGSVVKFDDDQHVVYAWASVATLAGKSYSDQQGDTIDDHDLEKAANDFVLHVRDAGEMHDKIGVGKLVASLVFTPEIQKALGIDLGKTGWFTGWKVTDPEVWKKIKSGEYGSMSIHGTGVRTVVE